MRTSILPGVTTTAATDRSDLRRASFLAQDGLVLSCALWALDELGILTPSLEREQTLAQLYPGLPARAGTRWALGDLRTELRAVVLGHLDGALVAPLLLSGTGVRLPDGAGRILRRTRWSSAEAVRYAQTLGMSASYLPMFGRLPDLFRGSVVVRPD